MRGNACRAVYYCRQGSQALAEYDQERRAGIADKSVAFRIAEISRSPTITGNGILTLYLYSRIVEVQVGVLYWEK